MARSCGIHIDQRRFHLVALDGSPKKAKIVGHGSGEIPPGEAPVAAVASALKDMVKDQSIRAENIGLAVDSGLAAFRNLTVPFDDRAKIEDIIKFEVESDLPQWNIDDVIVDFLVLGTKPGVESNLLVTAIPKMRLERQLFACERGGLEATHAELDGTALLTAAEHSGVIAEDAAQVLVHVGDSTTTVVVVDGGKLLSMRAIRAGAFPHTHILFDETGDDADGALIDAEGETEGEAATTERLAQTAKRIQRELGRTVSGAQTEHEIEAIYLTGHKLEGLGDGPIFDVPVVPLEVAEVGEQELAIAYGAALSALGGSVLAPELRREDLKYSGKFERLELPLAVFSLLLCTLLGVKLIVTMKQLDWRDEGTPTSPGDMQLWAQYSNMYLLPNAESGWPGRLKNPSDTIDDYVAKIESGEDVDRTKWEELKELERKIKVELFALRDKVGITADFPQPQSSLQATVLVMGVIDELGGEIGRYGVRLLQADYRQAKRSSPDLVEVRLDMDFFADDDATASRNYAALRSALREKSWCLDFPERSSRPFPDGGGLAFDGLTIQADVAKALAEREG